MSNLEKCTDSKTLSFDKLEELPQEAVNLQQLQEHACNTDYQSNKTIINKLVEELNISIINKLVEELNISSSIKNILLNYCKDDLRHSKSRLTYTEMLLPVLDFIKNSIHKEDLLNSLCQKIQQIEDSSFLNKKIFSFDILYDYYQYFVNENIDNEQTEKFKEMLLNKIDDVSILKKRFILEMKESGYGDEIIDKWVGYIEENY
ncbi:leucine-rich repeat protein [Hokovirus HKV1]|uniref:Leucine-rich repeat protein n=1 Tax=Hokovirus HKV1 TaxID=1977638 RepID=A0A1V0SFP4_9VIRU|nr:leucine-rich repeat protein [Hokovirus HKV1]